MPVVHPFCPQKDKEEGKIPQLAPLKEEGKTIPQLEPLKRGRESYPPIRTHEKFLISNF